MCATGPATEAFSDVVTVNASKEGRSQERFSYVVRECSLPPPPPFTKEILSLFSIYNAINNPSNS